MATITTNPSPISVEVMQEGTAKPRLTFPEAMELLSREERFMATVYAMNSLMIAKGYYTAEEHERLYCDWAAAQLNKPTSARTGWPTTFLSRLFSNRPK